MYLITSRLCTGRFENEGKEEVQAFSSLASLPSYQLGAETPSFCNALPVPSHVKPVGLDVSYTRSSPEVPDGVL
jgi:hypothetical protein